MPLIVFVCGLGPIYLMCRNHNNRTKNGKIHNPRVPNHILPARNSYQTEHDVL